MTPTRWIITAFWAVVILLTLKYVFTDVTAVAPPTAPEQHWYPPPLPGSPLPASAQADVRLIHYVPQVTPGAGSFTADVTIQNFGQKKATGIQVRIQPYVGTADSTAAPGPDEMPTGGDSVTAVFQWLDFPDLAPGATEMQTVTLPMRSDATPAEEFKPQVIFQTAKP
jgi:hypothetical protein